VFLHVLVDTAMQISALLSIAGTVLSAVSALRSATSAAETQVSPENSLRAALDELALPGGHSPTDGAYKVDDARSWLAGEQASFAAELSAAFRAAGIAASPSPVLRVGDDGRIVVANPHPDKARIEKLINESPELESRFKAMAAAADLVRVGDSHAAFAQDYARLSGDPAAQASLVYARIAENKSQQFNFVPGANGGEVFFSRRGQALASA
jgi:hypothetical protein